MFSQFWQALWWPLVWLEIASSLSVVSRTQIPRLPSSVCREGPARPWGLETFTHTRNHRKHPEENVPPSFSAPLSPPAPSPPRLLYRRWIWDQRAWERSEVSERKAQMTLRWISTKWSRLSHTITTPQRSFSFLLFFMFWRSVSDRCDSAIF